MKEITVIVDNRAGMLADLSQVLAARKVNIESIDGESAESRGIIRLTVDRYDEALSALRDSGFQAISEDALLIRLKDESGALARAAARFKDANINIRSLRILRRDAGFALVTVVTEDNQAARHLVSDVLVGSDVD
jgi:hypothetical protein